MALKSIGLTQSLNATDDPRANIAVIDERSSQLNGAFTNNTGSCQHGGVTNLHKKIFASTESIKTIDDNGVLVEVIDSVIPTGEEIDYSGTYIGLGFTYIGGGSKNYMILVDLDLSGTGKFLKSTDGTTWTLEEIDPIEIGISSGNIINLIKASEDPATMILITDNVAANEQAILYGGPGGWGSVTLNVPSGNADYTDTTHANGYFFIINNVSNKIAITQWSGFTIKTLAFNIPVYAAYGGGKYVFVGAGYQPIYSTNLSSFTQITTLTGYADFTDIIYYNSLFYIATGNAGKIYAISPSDFSVVHSIDVPYASRFTVMNNVLYTSYSGKYCLYSSDGLTFHEIGTDSILAFGDIKSNGTNIFVYASGGTDKGELITDHVFKQAYINSIGIGNKIVPYGIENAVENKKYDDIFFGSTYIYGVYSNGNNITVDILDSDLIYDSNYANYFSNENRITRFVRGATNSDTHIYIMYIEGGKTYFNIDGTGNYGAIATIFQSAYVLHATNKKVLVGNEHISNADGRAIGVWSTYTLAAGTSTLIDSKDGWFLSYNHDGVIGIIGVEKSGAQYQFINYTVDAAGAFTAVNTPSLGSMIYSINGLYSEYEPYQSYSAFAEYTAFSKSGTGADDIHMLGYFSVIDCITIDNDVLYLRAVYNRGLKSCDSLSISYSNNYIGRQIGVSDVDFSFRPQFVSYGGNYKLLYKNLSGNLTYIVIDDIANCTTQFTKIQKNLYLLNTLDPYNLLDTQGNNLLASGADYNGAVQYSASTKEHLKIVNDFYETTYNNETGIAPEANETITAPYDQKFVYKAETHSYYVFDGSVIENDKYNSPAYTDDHGYIPIPCYSFPQNKFVNVLGEIYPLETLRLLNISFLNQIGNITYSAAQFFYLFGSSYMYDGSAIYLLDVQNQTVNEVCRAQGLSFAAFSQEMAYFFSYCDNSIWAFNGGRSLQKLTQLHNLFAIDTTTLITGDYSTRDNLLFLSKAGVNVFLYDKTLSYYSDSTGSAFIGDSGVYYKKTTEIDQISPFKQDANFTAMTLTWQSAYFKTPGVIYSVNQILLYLKSDVSGAGTIAVTYIAFLEDSTVTTQTETFTVAATDYDSAGYLSLKLYPKQVSCYGFSVGLSTAIDIVIIDVSVDTAPIATATVMARKSS